MNLPTRPPAGSRLNSYSTTTLWSLRHGVNPFTRVLGRTVRKQAGMHFSFQISQHGTTVKESATGDLE